MSHPLKSLTNLIYMENKKNYYVNNKALYESLINYNEEKKITAQPKIPEYVGEAILLITNKLASRGNFNNYSYKDEMVSDGIENCLAAIDNYDVTKYDNPFGYFSRIAWYAFIRRIDREKRQNYLKYKNYRKHLAEEELSNIGEINLNLHYNIPNDDVSDEIIKNYEDSIRNKKEQKRKKEQQNKIEKFIKKEG